MALRSKRFYSTSKNSGHTAWLCKVQNLWKYIVIESVNEFSDQKQLLATRTVISMENGHCHMCECNFFDTDQIICCDSRVANAETAEVVVEKGDSTNHSYDNAIDKLPEHLQNLYEEAQQRSIVKNC